MKPKNRPACDLLFPSDKMRKGIVGNNRNAEMNVVKVKPQSRKNCEVNRAKFVWRRISGDGCLSEDCSA
jgi:hypothetical protein